MSQLDESLCLLCIQHYNPCTHTTPSSRLQSDLDFPCIHYRAVAICMAFIPQVEQHMEIAQNMPCENIAV